MHFTSAELAEYTHIRNTMAQAHLDIRKHLCKALDPARVVDNRPVLDALLLIFHNMGRQRLSSKSSLDQTLCDLTLLALSHHLHHILNFVLPTEAVPSLPPIDASHATFEVTHPTPTTAHIKPLSSLAPYSHATLHLEPLPILQIHLPGSPPLILPATPVFTQHLLALLHSLPAARP